MIPPSLSSSFSDARNKPSLAKEESESSSRGESYGTSTYRSGENASCPISALVRDGPANHVREPGRDNMQKEFSNESHSWWRSCVEEQCECFNFRGYTINSGFCLWDIFIKTCVRAFETCRSRIACIPFSGLETGERVIPGSAIPHALKEMFPGI
ncbi:hypothetical protein CEXT_28041 [Caerostris extrusa]|uniref:Uncharacterized protein n=1 Tax=Caerostris extrusa TaxID=172846 RepID=A0AAV4NCU7_CAEEX|nr:hypothetical protein CEXT_28041 [Caerostris extrusa]